jgi:subtilase family serine protease
VEAAWGINTFGLTVPTFSLPPPFIDGFIQGTGGGESVYLEKPSFQKSLPGTGRQLPDVSAIADPQTGAIIVSPDANNEPVFGVIGGTSLATPVFSAIWALADQAAGESLGQAAPIIAKMAPGALTDIVPIVTTKKKDNTWGTIKQGSNAAVAFDPADLLGLSQTQPEGFVGAMVVTHQILGGTAVTDLGFGADSSLMATTGWDNATGWGVPNGLKFINAAKKAAKGTLD